MVVLVLTYSIVNGFLIVRKAEALYKRGGEREGER